ncbi:SurA N-terminal domain-containing protein [Pseudoxanthobacter sp.]|uniref:peptidylprolyl isomerase n=1 Tax=Pseudoxanthobacter sp. TaxID=1925742 RepID=UPI002FE2ECEE
MLNQMRRGAGNWVAKLLMGVLVVSFVVWGVADAFRGMGVSTIASVGGTDVPLSRFQRDYARALQQLSANAGQPINPADAAAFGLPQQVLGRIVTETVLNNTADGLGIGITDDELLRQIKADPTFKGADGQFSADRMRQLLAANELAEADYIAAMRGLSIRRQIMDGLFGGVTAPAVLVQAVNTYASQQRTVHYLDVPPQAVGAAAEPSEAELKAFFEAHKASFRAPEFRTFQVATLDPVMLAAATPVSDEDVKADYERNAGKYGTPERRNVQQIPFPDRAGADAAAARLAAGSPLADILAERKLTDSDIDLGLVAKSGLIDPKVADAAFGAPLNQPVVVDGRFGPVIVIVTQVQPGQQKSFADVAADIKRSLADDLARRKMMEISNQIEDARAGGATLKEIADRFHLAFVEVQKVDSSGENPAGTTVNVPGGQPVLSAAFQADPGSEPDAVKLASGGLAWIDVTDVTPARDRALSEVTADVTTAWKADATQKALVAKAAEIAAAVRKGQTLEAIAAGLNVDVMTSAPFRRGGAAEGLSPDAVAAAFNGPKGFVATAASATGGQSVLVVTEVYDPPFDATLPASVQLGDQVTESVSNALLSEYVAALEAEAGIKINQAALNQVVAPGRGS